MENEKKRKAVYNREADKRYREKNKERTRYTNYRSRVRVFITELATPEDLAELEALITERRAEQ